MLADACTTSQFSNMLMGQTPLFSKDGDPLLVKKN
jgi:hypothetical protein